MAERCQCCGQVKRRTLPQNSYGHTWYADIAKQLPEDDAAGWKCYCKLHHGVPILRAESEHFKQSYDAAIKGLGYEQKLQAMRILPVTSLMNKDQYTRYLEQVREDFSKKGVWLSE